jgi:CRISPR-associated protein Csd2
MGRKYTIPYGLYKAFGFISPSLANQTGFELVDLELLWEALLNMFDHDHSAARGLMSTQRLIIFEHNSMFGNAPAQDLFARVSVNLKNKEKPARSFSDYTVCLDGNELSQVKTLVTV